MPAPSASPSPSGALERSAARWAPLAVAPACGPELPMTAGGGGQTGTTTAVTGTTTAPPTTSTSATYCDTAMPTGPPALQCLPWYEPGQAPAGLEDLGPRGIER